MAGLRRERSSSRNRNKLVLSLLEDRINSIKISRRRSGDEDEDEEGDDVENAPPATGGGAEGEDAAEGEAEEAPQEEEPPPPPPPPPAPDPNKYAPTPYTFRIPVGPQTREVRHGYARCPPFYLQLDHTLAVIWVLFAKQPPTKPLGIAQLQWALNFLNSIKNQYGEQPKDISLCIQAIQDQLLDTYAALVNELTEDDEEASKTEEGERKACTKDTCPKTKDGAGSSQELINTSGTSVEKLSKTARDVQSDVVITNLPFSVNYMEMMKSSAIAGDRVYKTQFDKSLTDSQIQQEIEHLKQATAATMPDSKLGETRSRDDMLRFLNLWRKEQLEKVQAELKRLHSIENFIDNVDREGPAPPEKKPVKRVSIKEPGEEMG